VLTDKLIVERLVMLWVGHSTTHDDDHTRFVSRALHALSVAIDELREWYKTLDDDNFPLFDEEMKAPANHPRFFPFAYRYPLVGEDFRTVVEFEYLCPLQPDQSTCVTFRAMTKGGSHPKKQVVVKFVQRYSSEVHDVLAAVSMAPSLLYYGRIDPDVDYGKWKMVVMDYFDGKPSYDGDRHRDADVSKKVLEAIKVVHSAGYVLGDVRPPNVMIGEEDQVMLIDFDWAGEEGGVWYPAYMSEGIWTDGIERMEKIKMTHDTDMHKKWFSPNSPRK
jgi:serine/threonine protein kinase